MDVGGAISDRGELQRHPNHNTVPQATKITKRDVGFLRSRRLKRAETLENCSETSGSLIPLAAFA